ncbi:MAG: hypothetical protein J6W84_08225 [Bacteroidales bacterium]|nr:hypothetical protein [Bacteroidales bacterium]
MKKSFLLFILVIVSALFFACKHECHCIKKVGINTYYDVQETTGKCSSLNQTTAEYTITCTDDEPAKLPDLPNNVITIDGVNHVFNENSYSEHGDNTTVIDAFEEHPQYNTVAWLTVFMKNSQFGSKVKVKDFQKVIIGWMKDPAGSGEDNMVEVFGNNCTDDSYLIVNKNDNNGECTAEVHVTTLDNHTIVGKVTCKPTVVDKK